MSEPRDYRALTPGGSPDAAPTGHELTDVRYRPVAAAGIGLAVVLVLVAIAMRLLFGHYAAREAATSAPANPLAAEFGRAEPPEPRLQAAPIDDIQKLREIENGLLGSYGWVDRAAGVARIPIERAMDLLAERGLPARESGAAR